MQEHITVLSHSEEKEDKKEKKKCDLKFWHHKRDLILSIVWHLCKSLDLHSILPFLTKDIKGL